MKTILFNINKNNLESREKVVNREIKVVEDIQYVIINQGIDKEKETANVDFNLQLIFEKPGVSAEILGIFNLKKGKEIKILTSTKHIASNTSCTSFIKAVLNDNSSFDYRGKIIIGKKGIQTNAFLHDNVLVAGENTKRISQPALEIETNDVKASHGSTTGRIDENQLYYLKSRGLGEKEAKDLIKEGFLVDLIDKIKDKKIRENVLNKIKSKREYL
jgi:Fe-S cluster assembly protein SufD